MLVVTPRTPTVVVSSPSRADHPILLLATTEAQSALHKFSDLKALPQQPFLELEAPSAQECCDDRNAEHGQPQDAVDTDSDCESDNDGDSDSCTSTISVGRLNGTKKAIASSASTPQTPARKQVRFMQLDELYPIPNREEYTLHEVKSSYYAREDYHRMRQECYWTLVRAKEHEPLDEASTLRGLEALLPDSHERRSQRIERSQQAVLRMQLAQGQCRFAAAASTNATFIAQVYRSTTTIASKLAHQRALADQQAVSVVGEMGIPPRQQVIVR